MRGGEFTSEHEKQSFINILEELKSRAVIVEGKKDERALRALGLTHIIPLNNTPLAEFVDHIMKRFDGLDKSKKAVGPVSEIHEVIILTDFDKEGRKLEKRLDLLLRSHKVRVNRRLRRILMGFGKGRIEDFKNVEI